MNFNLKHNKTADIFCRNLNLKDQVLLLSHVGWARQKSRISVNINKKKEIK